MKSRNERRSHNESNQAFLDHRLYIVTSALLLKKYDPPEVRNCDAL